MTRRDAGEGGGLGSIVGLIGRTSGDVVDLARAVSYGALPEHLARWHVETDRRGRVRLGVRNVRTDDVRWLTGYWGTPPVPGEDEDLAGDPLDADPADLVAALAATVEELAGRLAAAEAAVAELRDLANL